MSIHVDQLAPDFSLPGYIAPGHTIPGHSLNNEQEVHLQNIKLSDFRGKNVVLYFYPKDDTMGCTKQACGFRDDMTDFAAQNTVVIGISKDNTTSHQKFITKYHLPFLLLSDVDLHVCQTYGVWDEKSMYGRTFFGITRSTFLIDKDGIIRHIWRKVKVSGHVKQILDALKQL